MELRGVWKRGGAAVLLMLALVFAGLAGPSRAAAQAKDLAQVLQVPELAQVLHDEGVQHGESLEREMLEGQGGTHWATEVARIYDAGRIEAAIGQALSAHMSPEQAAGAVAFYETELGQRILSLEISARVAMRDPDIEQAARAAFEQLLEAGDEVTLAPIRRYVEVNDLVERNVASAMSASYWFLSGMAEGEAIRMGEAGMRAQVWAEEDATRAETETWLYAYLLMAYRPLSAQEVDRYIAYADSDAGRAMNAALFAGFDDLYQKISYELGLRLAAAMRSSRI